MTVTNAAAKPMTPKQLREENAKLRDACNKLEILNKDQALHLTNLRNQNRMLKEENENLKNPDAKKEAVKRKPFETSAISQRRKHLSIVYGMPTRCNNQGVISMFSKKRNMWCIVPDDFVIPNSPNHSIANQENL